jgi:hypothetical protein
MASFKTLGIIFIVYTIFLLIYIESGYRYQDDKYLQCIKNCNETKTNCHRHIKYVEKLIAHLETLIVEKKNITECHIYSDKYPDYMYNNPHCNHVSECLGGNENYRCYHSSFDNPPDNHCICHNQLNEIFVNIWCINLFILFIYFFFKLPS